MTDQEFETQFVEANRRGLEAQVGEVHAVSARFDRSLGALVLGLRGGMALWVPVDLLQGVAGQAPELIERVELGPRGASLHWEELDADFSIQSIAAGSFGVTSWMEKLEKAGRLDAASIERRRAVEALQTPTAAAMGRKGGAARSDAKGQASRANGAKGGRPRKKELASA